MKLHFSYAKLRESAVKARTSLSMALPKGMLEKTYDGFSPYEMPALTHWNDAPSDFFQREKKRIESLDISGVGEGSFRWELRTVRLWEGHDELFLIAYSLPASVAVYIPTYDEREKIGVGRPVGWESYAGGPMPGPRIAGLGRSKAMVYANGESFSLDVWLTGDVILAGSIATFDEMVMRDTRPTIRLEIGRMAERASAHELSEAYELMGNMRPFTDLYLHGIQLIDKVKSVFWNKEGNVEIKAPTTHKNALHIKKTAQSGPGFTRTNRGNMVLAQEMGKLIADARKGLRLTQAELAERCSMGTNGNVLISKLERGKGGATIREVNVIVEFLLGSDITSGQRVQLEQLKTELNQP